jgi:hypothetical protein
MNVKEGNSWGWGLKVESEGSGTTKIILATQEAAIRRIAVQS